MNEMIIKFNEQDYLATYNNQTGYFEVDLQAPQIGGIYNANIKYTNTVGETVEDMQPIQILAKEKIKIETNKVFMWIFDYKDFEVKDIVEISDYEINIDEETNANTIVKVLKETTAKANDIIAIKINSEVVYWGIVDDIKNEDGKELYEYTLKYITNIFNEKIPLSKNVEDNNIEDGIYRIRSFVDSKKVLDVYNLSMENGANIQLWTNNNGNNQKWKIKRGNDGFYTIQSINSGKLIDIYNKEYKNGTNLQQFGSNGGDNQKWAIEHLENACYKLKTKGNSNYYMDVYGGSPVEGNNIQLYESNNTRAQKFFLEKLDEKIINEYGIEDYLEKMINEYFVNSKDTLTNRNYLEVRVKTHTKLNAIVSNVQENMYYLATWMTNCTQLYNINYNFFVENKKLIIEIENKTVEKELIDTQAQAICNYSEVFNTEVVSKVEVATNSNNYYLYLLNDRTTTTDATNTNRAEGRTERIYTENFEDAEQKALDIIKTNSYNHNVTFGMYNRIIKVGTPIAIKTKKSIILDTYISAIKINKSKLVEHTCGNIRTRLTEKLLKERNK